MVAFGGVWTSALKEMWGDSDVSLRLMSRRLGVDPSTTKRQATLAKLVFPRNAPRSDLMRQTLMNKPFVRETPTTNLVEYHQETWRSLMSNNTEVGTSQLRRLAPATYAWLRRNDPGWLKTNVPARLARIAPPERVNWQLRDRQLAQDALSACIYLQNVQGPPARISVARIARRMGQTALIQKHLERLPKTAQVLAVSADTRESFAVRRVNYMVQRYTYEGVVPKRWQLIRRAGLRAEIEATEPVEEAIQTGMEALEDSAFRKIGPVRDVA